MERTIQARVSGPNSNYDAANFLFWSAHNMLNHY